ncbi:MAG TPA: molybdopterin cofactor-binding domain-containing protein [Acidimicrobiia bacterium]|nr:molybdopterin cofactor-binding domain-containing protein [Acidimicrobiia bacterium]
MNRLSFELNGEPTTVTSGALTALELIRQDLGLTGAKMVCGTGSCGACVLQVDGAAVAACVLPVEDLDGASVLTVEGISRRGPHPVQRALAANDGLQCGFCTPGFVMEAAAFHDAWRNQHGTVPPSTDEVTRALAGHLCRCGAYPGIIAAVQQACEGRFDTGPIIGPRVDAEEKLTGAALYTVDVSLPRMLHARIIRSPLAHADVIDVDPSDAVAMAGVEGFVLLLPSDGRVRYIGQAVAAIAATSDDLARRAADAVVVHYADLGTVVGIDAALADDAPDIHGRGWTPPSSSEFLALPNLRRGNLRGPLAVGSVHRFLARKAVTDAAGSPLLIERRWEFPTQSHAAFEPHACVADWTDDRLTVYVSTQSVSEIRRSIATRFDLAVAAVTVRADHVGGAFGAKQGLNQEAIVAIELSRATGRPVRLVFDLHEELEVAGNRPGGRLELSMAGGADGKLPPFVTSMYADGGASAGQIVSTFQRLAYPGSPRGLYDYDVLTNGPPGRPMRAPGGPLAFASLEGAIDEYALALDRDPIELRRSWGDAGAVGRLYDWTESRPLWTDRPDPGAGRFRRAVGVGFGFWVYFYDPDTTVEVRSTTDGFVVATGSQDLGNGTRTALARAAAETLGVDVAMVRVEIGSSGIWGPASVGSRTTTSVFPATTAAATALARRLAEQARAELAMAGAEVVAGGLSDAGEFIPWSELVSRLEPTSETARRPPDRRRPVTPFTIGDLRMGLGLTHAAHIVEVEVDTRTGRIRPVTVEAALAVGRVHVPELARSQVHGGVIQGIGYSLYEERLLDPVTGLNVTTNFDQYRLPGIRETPEMTVEFIDGGFEHSASGSAGLSELATASVAAAVANAASRAVGHRFTRLPIRPDHVVAVLS